MRGRKPGEASVTSAAKEERSLDLIALSYHLIDRTDRAR
jgi:hypothetical protein